MNEPQKPVTTVGDSTHTLAYHEAAHATLGILAGMSLDFVTILPRGRSEGRTSFHPCPSHRLGADHIGVGKAWAQSQILVLLAGFAAEFVLRWRQGERDFSLSGCDRDLMKAHAIAREAGFDKGAFCDLVTLAIDLVRLRWDDIERVAYALLEEKTLIDEDLAVLLADDSQ